MSWVLDPVQVSKISGWPAFVWVVNVEKIFWKPTEYKPKEPLLTAFLLFPVVPKRSSALGF